MNKIQGDSCVPQHRLLADPSVDILNTCHSSGPSISTKKALDIACENILDKMIKKGVFTK